MREMLGIQGHIMHSNVIPITADSAFRREASMSRDLVKNPAIAERARSILSDAHTNACIVNS